MEAGVRRPWRHREGWRVEGRSATPQRRGSERDRYPSGMGEPREGSEVCPVGRSPKHDAAGGGCWQARCVLFGGTRAADGVKFLPEGLTFEEPGRQDGLFRCSRRSLCGCRRGATPAGGLLRRRGLLVCLGRRRLRRPLPLEARLERRDQVGGRRTGLDLDALDVLARDLLLNRLQEALPVLVLVVLGMELRRGQLTDQALGERPLLVTDLRSGSGGSRYTSWCSRRPRGSPGSRPNRRSSLPRQTSVCHTPERRSAREALPDDGTRTVSGTGAAPGVAGALEAGPIGQPAGRGGVVLSAWPPTSAAPPVRDRNSSTSSSPSSAANRFRSQAAECR